MGVTGFWGFGEDQESIGYLVCVWVETWFYLSENGKCWSRVTQFQLGAG